MDINLLELVSSKNPYIKHKFLCSEANNSYYEILFYYDQLKENNPSLNTNIITFRNNPNLESALKESSKTLNNIFNKNLISHEKYEMYNSKLKKSNLNIYTIPEAKNMLRETINSKEKTTTKEVNKKLFDSYINFLNS